MNEFLQTLLNYAVSLGGKLVVSAIIIFVGKYLIKLVLNLYKKTSAKSQLDSTVHTYVGNILKFALWCLLVITVVGVLGIPTASLITVFGSAGVAIGLAVQGSLSNFAGGIMLLVFKPFKVGDYIEAEGFSGTVESITIFYTYLKTPDNKGICMPNGKLTNDVIVNTSVKDTRRVDMEFSVAYDSDLDLVKDTLITLAENHPKVLLDKDIYARVSANGESAIKFAFRVWCNKEDYWDVKIDLIEQANEAFRIRGIEIPYNKMDVNVVNK